MFTLSTYSISDCIEQLTNNMGLIKDYIDNQDYTNSVDEELRQVARYLESLTKLDNVLKMAQLQLPTYLEVAKDKNLRYTQSLLTSERRTEIQLSKSKAYRNNKLYSRIAIYMDTYNEDNIRLDSHTEYLWWSERAILEFRLHSLKKKAIEELKVSPEKIKIIKTY